MNSGFGLRQVAAKLLGYRMIPMAIFFPSANIHPEQEGARPALFACRSYCLCPNFVSTV